MDQERIAQLLHQASFTDCARDQIRNILDELLQAIPLQKSHKDRCGLTERQIADRLFTDTIREDPRRLCSLFPVFALLCGERGKAKLPEIDWSVMCRHAQ